MLTPTDVLNYVKTQLGIPYTPIEYTDDQILDYIRQTSLRTFSRYIPHKNKIVLNLSDENVKTDIPNEFRLIDPDGCQIIDVCNVYTDQTGLILSGHPYMGLLGGNMEDVEKYVNQVETAGTVYKYSMFNERFEFIPPNIIRILPKVNATGSRLVEYERFHTKDFRTIRPEFEETFLRLAFCDVALWIARTRSSFRSFNTPFGDIELNVDDLRTEAQTERDKIIEDISMYNMPVIVDSG